MDQNTLTEIQPINTSSIAKPRNGYIFVDNNEEHFHRNLDKTIKDALRCIRKTYSKDLRIFRVYVGKKTIGYERCIVITNTTSIIFKDMNIYLTWKKSIPKKV